MIVLGFGGPTISWLTPPPYAALVLDLFSVNILSLVCNRALIKLFNQGNFGGGDFLHFGSEMCQDLFHKGKKVKRGGVLNKQQN